MKSITNHKNMTVMHTKPIDFIDSDVFSTMLTWRTLLVTGLLALVLSVLSLPLLAAELTIDDGVVVKFGADAQLAVRDHLVAGKGIIMTSQKDDSAGGQLGLIQQSPKAGDWLGMRLEKSAAVFGALTLNDLSLRYGGGATAAGGTSAALTVRGWSPTLKNLLVTDNSIGLRALEGANPGISGSSFLRNSTGIESDNNSGPSISNSQLVGNSIFAINNKTPDTIILATGNWWGHATGPQQAITNPSGQGDSVSTGVDFGNYLAAQPLLNPDVRLVEPAAYFDHHDVLLDLSCINATEYRIAEGSSFGNETFQPLTNYRAQVLFTTSAGDGRKSINVEYRNAEGAVVTATLAGGVLIDTQAPSVALINPVNGSDISQPITIEATASDDSGIANVQFFVDNQLVSRNTTAPYTVNWNITGIAYGPHTIKAVATDIAGRSTEQSVTVNLIPADNQGPQLTDVRADGLVLADGTTLVRSSTISFTASDISGVSRIDLLLDGNVFSSPNGVNGSYSATLNLDNVSNGSHTLAISATDSLGNISTASFAITVAHPLPDAPVLSEPANGISVRTATVTVSGTAQAGNNVQVFVNNNPAGSAVTAGSDGRFTTSVSLTLGSNQIQATASDQYGTGPASNILQLKLIPAEPGTPTIEQPLSGAQVTILRPTLAVQTSANPDDQTTQVQFELYADEAMTQLVATSLVDKAPLASVPQATVWTLPADLADNTHYWWRARAFDGTVYSPWANARFFVNLFNDAPNNFSLALPAPDAEVDTLTPVLSWNNSADKDGDAITYDVGIYKDAALTDKVAWATGIPETAGGSTHWLDTLALVNHSTYYWQVIAKDALGAKTAAVARSFVVNTGNVAPTDAVILSPKINGQSIDINTELKIQNSVDAEGDAITYVFEIDTVNTFDSANKENSGTVMEGANGTTSWITSALVENQRYWWRVKAQDGRADSNWVVGNFLMNAVNEAPGTPTIKNPGSGSWSSVLQPTLEANPVTDPEGGAVRYEFEVYQDAGLTQKVSAGISDNTALLVPSPLTDKTTYWWRVRALDPLDAASDWSTDAVLYVSTGAYQAPSIAVTTPSTPIAPVSVPTPTGVRKQVTIRWEGIDPNIEPTIALYLDTQQSGYAGTLIVDGLTQKAGAQTGSYVWDVSNLPSGDYYIYATISDGRGMGMAYAPGVVVIPNEPQAGKIVVTANRKLKTSETGKTAKFSIRLGTAPAADITLPLSSTDTREGTVSPASVTFTAQNWSKDQTITVTGVNDCAPDGDKAYQILSGQAVSIDPNYIGLSGRPVDLINADDDGHGDDDEHDGHGDDGHDHSASTTNNANVYLCDMRVVTKRKLSDDLWEYSLAAHLTNTGASFSSASAKLKSLWKNVQLVQGTVNFGQANQGDTILSNNTLTIRSRKRVLDELFEQDAHLKWDVTVLP